MDSQPRLPVALPAYETELAANQRTALRSAVLLAAPILVGFTLLDRATAPGHWHALLVVRLVAAGALVALARAARGKIPPPLLAGSAVAVIAATIETGVFVTGGARSPYLTSNIALLAGVGILIPLTARQALAMQMIGLGIALVPLLFRLQTGDGLPLITAAAYLATIAVVAVA